MTETGPDWAAFTPTEEARELAATAREHFAVLAPAALLQSVAEGTMSTALWTSLTESGYTAIGIPEENDGVGTIVDLIALLEEAGRSLLPAPLTTTTSAHQTLIAAGLPLPDVAGAAAAIADSGTLHAFDAASAFTVVTVESISGGSRIRRLATDPATHVVDASPIDRSRVGALIGDAEIVDEITIDTSIDHVLAPARTCIAADLVGTAARALDGAIAHASTRIQFDRLIGSFQAVKHRLADQHVAIERARSLVFGAAIEVSADPHSDAARDLSMLAKAAASEAAESAASVHTQLLGAMGLTFEGASQLEVRRARHSARHLGSASDLYARVAALRAEKGTTR